MCIFCTKYQDPLVFLYGYITLIFFITSAVQLLMCDFLSRQHMLTHIALLISSLFFPYKKWLHFLASKLVLIQSLRKGFVITFPST